MSHKGLDHPLFPTNSVSRRGFLQAAGTAALLAGVGASRPVNAAAAPAAKASSESLVKILYDSLSAEQRKQVCFAWDHQADTRGLLRRGSRPTGTSPSP